MHGMTAEGSQEGEGRIARSVIQNQAHAGERQAGFRLFFGPRFRSYRAKNEAKWEACKNGRGCETPQ